MEAAVQKGLGDTLNSVTVVGAMLCKQVAESGAAQQIVTALMGAFGLKNIQRNADNGQRLHHRHSAVL